MGLSEDEINEKMANTVAMVIQILYFHTNMNLRAFHADIT